MANRKAVGADRFAAAPVLGFGNESAPTPVAYMRSEPGDGLGDDGYHPAWWRVIMPDDVTPEMKVRFDLVNTVLPPGADGYYIDPVIEVFRGDVRIDPTTSSVLWSYLWASGDDGDRAGGYLTDFDATGFDPGETIWVRVRLNGTGWPTDASYVLRVGELVHPTYGPVITPPVTPLIVERGDPGPASFAGFRYQSRFKDPAQFQENEVTHVRSGVMKLAYDMVAAPGHGQTVAWGGWHGSFGRTVNFFVEDENSLENSPKSYELQTVFTDSVNGTGVTHNSDDGHYYPSEWDFGGSNAVASYTFNRDNKSNGQVGMFDGISCSSTSGMRAYAANAYGSSALLDYDGTPAELSETIGDHWIASALPPIPAGYDEVRVLGGGELLPRVQWFFQVQTDDGTIEAGGFPYTPWIEPGDMAVIGIYHEPNPDLSFPYPTFHEVLQGMRAVATLPVVAPRDNDPNYPYQQAWMLLDLPDHYRLNATDWIACVPSVAFQGAVTVPADPIGAVEALTSTWGWRFIPHLDPVSESGTQTLFHDSGFTYWYQPPKYQYVYNPRETIMRPYPWLSGGPLGDRRVFKGQQEGS